MTTTLRVPDLLLSAAYYPALRQAIRRRNRQACPTVTVEDPLDPFMQLEEVLALVGHLLNARLDFTARHLFLPTSLRRGSVGALIRLIDETLAPAAPSTAEVVGRLTRAFTTAVPALVPGRSRFATVGAQDAPSVSFESGAADQACTRTDQLLKKTYDASTTTWADWAVGADAWATAAAAGDLLYVGHADLMFDAFALALATAMSGVEAVWEYHGTTEGRADVVAWDGTNLTLTLDGFFGLPQVGGGTSKATGASVVVRCVSTGREVTLTSIWSGGANKVTTTDTLGQVVPSTSVNDYVVAVAWTLLPDLDGAQALLASTTETAVSWRLPQSSSENWTPAEINGVDGYWIRLRVIEVAGPVEPVLAAGGLTPGEADFYALVQTTQGETVDDVLGTSDGTNGQRFTLARNDYVAGTLSLRVGTDTDWVVTTDAADFYSSEPGTKIVYLEEQPDESWDVLFGGGEWGSAPPVSDQVAATYRRGATDNGNAGAETITRNVSGLAYLTDIRNPRSAAGWAAAEGSTREDLERVKRTKPAALRSRGKVVQAADAAALAVDEFTTSDGSRPVVRAWAVEELFGLKTIGVICVGQGGAVPTAAILSALDTWFNGETTDDPARRMLANQEAVSVGYTPRVIDGEITITVDGSTSGIAAEVAAILLEVLSPTALREDGTWAWTPGGAGVGRVSATLIGGEVFRRLSRPPVDVEVTSLEGVAPPVAVLLAAGELPYPGTWIVSVVGV